MRGTMFKVVAVAGLGLATAAQAALPPKYQRQRELEEVLKAALDVLRDPVDQIVRTGEDRYTVVAGRCTVRGWIVTLPSAPRVAGPRSFRVKLASPRCR